MTMFNDNAFLERTLRGRFRANESEDEVTLLWSLRAFFRLEFVGNSREYLTFQLGASFCLCGACAKNASDIHAQPKPLQKPGIYNTYHDYVI